MELMKPIHIYKYSSNLSYAPNLNYPNNIIVIANSCVNLKHICYFADIRLPCISRIIAKQYKILAYNKEINNVNISTKVTFKEAMKLYNGVLTHEVDYRGHEGLVSPKIIQILEIILFNWDE
jgi:hypothetical protein